LRRFTVCFGSLAEMPSWLFARLVSSSFYLSHDIRRDVVLSLVFLEEGLAIRLVGGKLRHVHVDEQSLSGIYRKAVSAMERGARRRVHWGIYVSEAKRELKASGYRVVTGKGCSGSLEVPQPHTFYFSCGHGREEVCLSPRQRPVDAAIAVLNVALDRQEQGRRPLP